MKWQEAGKWLFLLFLTSAAWQDIKTRGVSTILYWIFGAMGCICRLAEGGTVGAAAAALIGGALLCIGRWSGGGIGKGDGWFFVVAGLYLGFPKTLFLLFSSTFFCGIFCAFLVVWGRFANRNMRKAKIPFLPFLLPFGYWMALV